MNGYKKKLYPLVCKDCNINYLHDTHRSFYCSPCWEARLERFWRKTGMDLWINE